ncbi:MAG: FkbM family methyltransferase, partial [Bacteroidota bacterium]|nr:FkbM family methyltransferase [Bacteroidota bacterium]
PRMVEQAKQTFKSQFESGQLKVFNYAISDEDNTDIEFNVSEWTLWNSLRKEIAGRDNTQTHVIVVKTHRLDTLMNEHGVPYYCKIDIEGYDALAVNTLQNTSSRPVFISVETECIGDKEIITEDKALETLISLNAIGYNRFKLVDQKTQEILTQVPFYGVKKALPAPRSRNLIDKILRRPIPANLSHFDQLRKKHKYNFPVSSTGPFGTQLDGEWVNFESAKDILLFHRKMYFNLEGIPNYSFWCDWHATTV